MPPEPQQPQEPQSNKRQSKFVDTDASHWKLVPAPKRQERPRRDEEQIRRRRRERE